MTRSTSPCIIPFFISHQGCPHQCIFCNQEVITGENRGHVDGKIVGENLDNLLSCSDRKKWMEVAFFGGSFSGIPEERQKELLGAVQPFLKSGRVHNIRISTRPDYVDKSRAAFLRSYGVGTVELGVQSLDREVLAASGRGHTIRDVEKAFAVLQHEKFKTGGQLMIGLPGDSHRRVMESCYRLADLGPDMVRIYPALVLEGSPLARMYREGTYRPLTLHRALVVTAKIREFFDRRGIPVIRMGLQPTASLERDLLAGPYHPAFGELVSSRIFYKKIRKILAGLARPARITLASRDESVFRGRKNANLKRLGELGLLDDVQIAFSRNQVRSQVLAESL